MPFRFSSHRCVCGGVVATLSPIILKQPGQCPGMLGIRVPLPLEIHRSPALPALLPLHTNNQNIYKVPWNLISQYCLIIPGLTYISPGPIPDLKTAGGKTSFFTPNRKNILCDRKGEERERYGHLSGLEKLMFWWRMNASSFPPCWKPSIQPLYLSSLAPWEKI